METCKDRCPEIQQKDATLKLDAPLERPQPLGSGWVLYFYVLRFMMPGPEESRKLPLQNVRNIPCSGRWGLTRKT